MVSMSNKAQMQAIVDAMLDDEVLLDDFLVKGAGLRAHRQAAQPTEWIKFCKWYCPDATGLSLDIAEGPSRHSRPRTRPSPLRASHRAGVACQRDRAVATEIAGCFRGGPVRSAQGPTRQGRLTSKH